MLFVRPEHKVEPGLPGFAAVERGESGFANATLDRLPDAANVAFFSGSGAIHAAQVHGAVLEATFYGEQAAAIGDPGLVPDFARGVVDAEALAFVSVNGLIVLVHNAAIENARDADARVFRAGGDVEHVPIPEPEIELMKFESGARSRG